jgi:hypothetical protein
MPGLFLDGKRPESKSDYTSPLSSKAKNEWIYTYYLPARLYGVDWQNFIIIIIIIVVVVVVVYVCF